MKDLKSSSMKLAEQYNDDKHTLNEKIN